MTCALRAFYGIFTIFTIFLPRGALCTPGPYSRIQVTIYHRLWIGPSRPMRSLRYIVNCTRIRTQTPHPISYLLRLTHQTHFTRSVRPSLKQSEKSLISVNSQDHSISKRLLYGIFSVLPGIPHAHHRLNQTALNQRWFNAGPPSATLAQHRTSIE